MPSIFEKVNDRWEIGVGVSDGSFSQISYVNSISTTKGGQHVNYIADQVVKRLLEITKKKNKGVELKPAHIKNHLSVYVNTLVENPAFDSQTKENLTTRSSQFGSKCVLSDKFLKQVVCIYSNPGTELLFVFIPPPPPALYLSSFFFLFFFPG